MQLAIQKKQSPLFCSHKARTYLPYAGDVTGNGLLIVAAGDCYCYGQVIRRLHHSHAADDVGVDLHCMHLQHHVSSLTYVMPGDDIGVYWHCMRVQHHIPPETYVMPVTTSA